jgi:competence protein ComGC
MKKYLRKQYFNLQGGFTLLEMIVVLVIIEPIAILLIGLVMGTIIIGVILAITSANDIPL